jgi:3-dehydroquinate synthase
MRTVEVQLGERTYPIYIGPGLLGSVGARLLKLCPAPTAAVVSDENVAPLYADRAIASMNQAGYRTRLLVVKPGELSKSLETAAVLYGGLAEAGIERTSPVVSLGGGVVGDLTGFVAATWLRGLPFVQVPTTLEADLDAAVGGKTAVNHPAGKNLIGAFHQPRMVLIDPTTLATLDVRDLRSGLAESVKHGVIRDAALFEWQERWAESILSRDEQTLGELIERNCRIKAAVVAADERESGLRAILNFGHTIGHAIESDQRYALRHGECVAIGMVAAAEIAVVRGMLPRSDADRIRRLLEKFGLPTRVDRTIDLSVLMAFMQKDKKIAAGRLRFVLPTAIGQAVTVSDVTPEQIAAGVRAIQPDV